jgi:DNA-binding NarL/FixJ family response regulator
MKSTARARAAKSAREAASKREPWHGSAAAAEQDSESQEVHLTPRELEVLALMCEGLSNKVIGRHLKISPSTVKVHVSKILRALNVSNRLQAILVTNDWRLLEQHVNHNNHGSTGKRKPEH